MKLDLPRLMRTSPASGATRDRDTVAGVPTLDDVNRVVRRHAQGFEHLTRRAGRGVPSERTLQSTLQRAVVAGRVADVNTLVRFSVDPRGALDLAHGPRRAEMVDTMLAPQVDHLARTAVDDRERLAPVLVEAAARGATRSVAVLLRAGADPNSRIEGQPTLHRVVAAATADVGTPIAREYVEAADQLVQRGANLLAPNRHRERAWDVLQASGRGPAAANDPNRARMQAVLGGQPSLFHRIGSNETIENIARHLPPDDLQRLGDALPGVGNRIPQSVRDQAVLRDMDRLDEAVARGANRWPQSHRAPSTLPAGWLARFCESVLKLEGPAAQAVVERMLADMAYIERCLPTDEGHALAATLLRAWALLPSEVGADRSTQLEALGAIGRMLQASATSDTVPIPRDTAEAFIRQVDRMALPANHGVVRQRNYLEMALQLLPWQRRLIV